MPFGALFKSKNKVNDKAPDYSGSVDVDDDLVALVQGGHDKLQLAGWLKTSKTGNKYISISLSAPYNKGNKTARRGGNSSDDDIPF
jgi:uncharacterized protein (DUF736 family)